MGINQIHAILLSDTDYKELKQKINTFDKKTLSTEMSHFFTLINQFAREAKSSLNSIDPICFVQCRGQRLYSA